MSREALFVATTPGLEAPLAAELSALGFPGTAVPGGVTLEAPAGSYRTLNLWSRLASRVLLRVAEVPSVEALRRVALAPWGREFEVEASGEASGKWASALRSTKGAPLLLLRGERGRCTVSVDTSGELLYFRGYRQEVGRAPLRETLASGVLRLAGWRPGEPLWDLMCGSGTLLIEAAEQAAGLAPGRNRAFAFAAFPSHDEAAWRALPRQTAAVPTALVGSDLNAGALGTARRNARRAGVLEALTLERLDATALAPRAGAPGLVVANLPYGKRVGERDALAGLYRALGASLKRACKGFRFAFLLEEGAAHLGLPLDARHAVSNGGLRCEVVVGRVP